MKDKYIIIIIILSVLLIISFSLNIIAKRIIDDKTEIIKGCYYEADWAKRMLKEIK